MKIGVESVEKQKYWSLDKYFVKSISQLLIYQSVKKSSNVYTITVSQCGNVGNLPPIQKDFVKSIYSQVTLTKFLQKNRGGKIFKFPHCVFLRKIHHFFRQINVFIKEVTFKRVDFTESINFL